MSFSDEDLLALRHLAEVFLRNIYFLTLHLMVVAILWLDPSDTEPPSWFSALTFMVVGWPIAALLSLWPRLTFPIYLMVAHGLCSTL